MRHSDSGAGKHLRCMVCARGVPLSGGICQACNENIRAQAQGTRRDIRDRADRELRKHGVKPGE